MGAQHIFLKNKFSAFTTETSACKGGYYSQGCNATRIMSRITRIILLIILVILVLILVILVLILVILLIILVAYHP